MHLIYFHRENFSSLVSDQPKDGSYDDGKLIIVTDSQILAIPLHRCNSEKINSCRYAFVFNSTLLCQLNYLCEWPRSKTILINFSLPYSTPTVTALPCKIHIVHGTKLLANVVRTALPDGPTKHISILKSPRVNIRLVLQARQARARRRTSSRRPAIGTSLT